MQIGSDRHRQLQGLKNALQSIYKVGSVKMSSSMDG
jgi:hypothetical protein